MNSTITKTNSLENVNYASVVGLVPNTPYNRIMSFIKEFDSDNTKNSYVNHYRKMFSYMTGKKESQSLEQLTYNDIKLIDKDRVKDYRQFLKENYKTTTINQRIFACKSLWDEFRENDIVNINPFDFLKKQRLKEEENNYGSLTLDEIEKLYQFTLQREYKSMTQKLYWEFLFVVTCRKHVAQTLTWDQIERELDLDTKEMIWVVSFTGENKDKGKSVKKSITDEFYNRLYENYTKEKETNGKVFCGINNETYDNTLKAFCKEYNIDSNRNIVQHSLKSSGLDFIQGVLGDINVTAQAAQHSSIQTTYKKYLNKNKKYSSQPSFMLHKNYSIDMLKELDKDELLGLIEKAGKETVVKLCLELNKQKGN